MDFADVEAVCRAAPSARVIATHFDSVNHARITGDEMRRKIRARHLTQVRVPEDGEWTEE